MTNSEKITMDCIKNGVYSADEVKAFLSAGQDLPIHTAYEWKQLGYHVKKGEHAKLRTKLWKMVPVKKNGNADDEAEPQFFLTDAFLFTSDQVERTEKMPDEAVNTDEVFK